MEPPNRHLGGEYAVESEIAGLPRVKGRLTRVHSIYWRSMGPTPSAAAGPTTTMGCSTHVPTLKAPRATLSLRGHQFQLWCEVRGWCAAGLGSKTPLVLATVSSARRQSRHLGRASQRGGGTAGRTEPGCRGRLATTTHCKTPREGVLTAESSPRRVPVGLPPCAAGTAATTLGCSAKALTSTTPEGARGERTRRGAARGPA